MLRPKCRNACQCPGDIWFVVDHKDGRGSQQWSTSCNAVGWRAGRMVFTDPPYNVNYAIRWKRQMAAKPARSRMIIWGWLWRFLYDVFEPDDGLRRCVCCAWVRPNFTTLHGAFVNARWQMVNLHHLGEKYLHARACGLSTPVWTDPLAAEKMGMSISGAVRGIKAMSGLQNKPVKTICTRRWNQWSWSACDS